MFEKLKKYKTVIFGVTVFVISGVMIAQGLNGSNNFNGNAQNNSNLNFFANLFLAKNGTGERLTEEILSNGERKVYGDFMEQRKNEVEQAFSNTTNFKKTKKQKKKEIQLCKTNKTEKPVHNSVILNEVAWMGDKKGIRNEWVELKNISKKSVDLSSWQFFDKSRKTKVIFRNIKINPNNFLMLSRNSPDNIRGDVIFFGTLNNSNEELWFFDNRCNLVDRVLANPSWPAGDNKTKKTMERAMDLSWHTSSVVGGTPKAENSQQTTHNKQQKTENQQQIKNLQPTTNYPQRKTKVYITEIMAGKDGNGSYEFIELYNNSDKPINLTGWHIKKKSSTGKESTLVSSGRFEERAIQPFESFLIANEGGYSGNVIPDILWPKSYTIAYSNNSVVLYGKNNNKIDEVSWSNIPKNKSISRNLYNSSFIVSIPTPGK